MLLVICNGVSGVFSFMVSRLQWSRLKFIDDGGDDGDDDD